MNVDPVCAFHGKRWSEHEGGRCLYCGICFVTLTPDTCYLSAGGVRYDLCPTCGAREFETEPRTPAGARTSGQQPSKPGIDGVLYENPCHFCGGVDDVDVVQVLFEEEDGSDGLWDHLPMCAACREEYEQ